MTSFKTKPGKNKGSTQNLLNSIDQEQPFLRPFSKTRSHSVPEPYRKRAWDCLENMNSSVSLSQQKIDGHIECVKSKVSRTINSRQHLEDQPNSITSYQQQNKQFKTTINNQQLLHQNLKSTVTQSQELNQQLKHSSTSYETLNKDYERLNNRAHQRIEKVADSIEFYQKKFFNMIPHNIGSNVTVLKAGLDKGIIGARLNNRPNQAIFEENYEIQLEQKQKEDGFEFFFQKKKKPIGKVQGKQQREEVMVQLDDQNDQQKEQNALMYSSANQSSDHSVLSQSRISQISVSNIDQNSNIINKSPSKQQPKKVQLTQIGDNVKLIIKMLQNLGQIPPQSIFSNDSFDNYSIVQSSKMRESQISLLRLFLQHQQQIRINQSILKQLNASKIIGSMTQKQQKDWNGIFSIQRLRISQGQRVGQEQIFQPENQQIRQNPQAYQNIAYFMRQMANLPELRARNQQRVHQYLELKQKIRSSKVKEIKDLLQLKEFPDKDQRV